MKKIIFSGILIFVFCLAAFAQTTESLDPSLPAGVKLIAQFNDTDSEWYKLIPEVIGPELLTNPSIIGLISVKKDKYLALRLRKLRFGLAIRQVSLDRVIFSIVNKQDHDTNVLTASNCSEILKCKDCLVIRARDIDKINLRTPKTFARKRTRK